MTTVNVFKVPIAIQAINGNLLTAEDHWCGGALNYSPMLFVLHRQLPIVNIHVKMSLSVMKKICPFNPRSS